MAWRDELQPASFRGVPFEVEGATQQGGRRQAVHEYPQSERIEIEDLGAGAGRFSIDAFVLGDDYARRRDALIAALEMPGSGTLVHPYRGQRIVAVETWSCEETKGAGRLATFRLTFLRDDGLQLPAVGPDTRAASTAAAGAANAAAGDQFADQLSVATDADRGYSLQVLEDALQPIARAVQTVRNTADRVQLQLLNALVDPVSGARSILSDLIGTPGDLAGRIQGLIGNLDRVSDLGTLFDRGGSSVRVPPGTPTANRAVIDTLMQTSIAVRRAELSASTDYVSYEDAVADLAAITEQLDLVSHQADDATYLALQALRAAVASDIKARAADLARITDYTPAETLPALAIAHRLYGAAGVADRAAELVARNRIEHPGFVPGGQRLEVLTP